MTTHKRSKGLQGWERCFWCFDAFCLRVVTLECLIAWRCAGCPGMSQDLQLHCCLWQHKANWRRKMPQARWLVNNAGLRLVWQEGDGEPPAKGRGDSSRVFLRKWALGWGAGGRQFQGYKQQEQRQWGVERGGGGGEHSSRAVERAPWLQSLTWIKLGQAGASEIQVWCFCNNLSPTQSQSIEWR